MPSSLRAPRAPSYRRHKPSGQAVVSLCGRDFYLGRYGTQASRGRCDRLIAEWLAGGRTVHLDEEEACLTVAELLAAYWRFAKGYYQKNGQPTSEQAEYRQTIRLVRRLYGPTPAKDFGSLALKAVRERMIDAGWTRGVVNQRIGRVKRIFKWAVAEELVPPSVNHGLQAVVGLRRGRTTAREPAPIRPIEDAVVEATVGYLPEVVADMVRLQRLTGCRPGEVCLVRPCDVDTSGDVWVYRPESHKTEHHGRERVICIGPKGQDVLRPYLLREKTAYCFSPIESERRRRAEQHARRTTPLSYGNRPGTNRKRKPKTRPRGRYDTNSYARAIHRAVELANRQRVKDGDATLPKWSPNRLRHAAATEIRRQSGLEAAQVALGHASADVSQICAERDLGLAVQIMRKIG